MYRDGSRGVRYRHGMADLDRPLGDWTLKHWPWSIGAVWLGYTLAIGLPVWAIFGTDHPTSLLVQPMVLALAPTFLTVRSARQTRGATPEGRPDPA